MNTLPESILWQVKMKFKGEKKNKQQTLLAFLINRLLHFQHMHNWMKMFVSI